ncbi:MAG: hypothetical protein KDD25_08235 [Bdellovibrionales bacterium]|nr:hypothetical protein [Bdellovibrionales bacterium]
MIERRQIIYSSLVFYFLLFVVSSTETSILAQILGATSVPCLFLAVCTYVSIHRKIWEALLFVYLGSFVLSSFSLSPWGFFVFGQLAALMAVRFVRDRVYWPGLGYFIMVYVLSIGVYQVTVSLFSLAVDENPMHGPFWWSWLFQVLWAPVVAAPMMFLMEFIDNRMKRTSEVSEVEGV